MKNNNSKLEFGTFTIQQQLRHHSNEEGVKKI